MKDTYCFLLLAAVWVPITGCENKLNRQNNMACIIVFIQYCTARIDREIPETLDCYLVQIEVSGPIKVLPQ